MRRRRTSSWGKLSKRDARKGQGQERAKGRTQLRLRIVAIIAFDVHCVMGVCGARMDVSAERLAQAEGGTGPGCPVRSYPCAVPGPRSGNGAPAYKPDVSSVRHSF
jgi:hypothetical protein